jgi:hypothetical protein
MIKSLPDFDIASDHFFSKPCFSEKSQVKGLADNAVCSVCAKYSNPFNSDPSSTIVPIFSRCDRRMLWWCCCPNRIALVCCLCVSFKKPKDRLVVDCQLVTHIRSMELWFDKWPQWGYLGRLLVIEIREDRAPENEALVCHC